MSKKLLTDNEAHDALLQARELLSQKSGITKRAETAIRAADKALLLLAIGLLMAAEEGSDGNKAIIDQKPVSPSSHSD
ncbi:hypothetical protein [Rhizobium alvei]|uniref:Conjugal transfer protein TraD n=1 Tax=Rhizobium alvei TaxID=1132659 RepID=A0ABT8YUR3_9HYPH|nr:hypothetical protein [Rhizobium alvei]MDO6966984.1 hypothetical protein [Rhizobium alvei]